MLKKWSDEEKQLLEDNYRKLSWKELYILFPDRSINSVKCKVDDIK